MRARHRRRSNSSATKWLRASAFAVGLGAAIAVGQGTASASPSDGSDGADASGASDAPVTDTGDTRSKADPSSADTSADAPTSTVSAQQTITVDDAATPSVRVSATRAVGNRGVTARQARSAGVVDDVLTRLGVTPSASPKASSRPVATAGARVLDGKFTDATITDTNSAATVLNNLAGRIGAPDGFADADAITVQHAGQGATSETFYRLRQTAGSVPVVGGDVVLVTDGDGNVRSLFNYRDSRIDTMSVTPDPLMGDWSADLAAKFAYVTSAVGRPDRWATLPLVAVARTEPELVVYAVDPDAPPRLAWRTTIDPSDPFQVIGLTTPQPDVTYFIAADGADAGAVVQESSPDSFLPTTPTSVTAADALGQVRNITIARVDLLNIDTLSDATRNLTTYRWIGLVTPVRFIPEVLPVLGGFPVFGLAGWDPSAVSAHANLAEVYDYYENVVGLTSYDGNGAPIDVVVGFNPLGPLGFFSPYKNAYWDPANRLLVFGDGGNLESTVDITGHEYSHAVFAAAIGESGNLSYSGEPGALNEAYADIFGSLIEGKTGPNRWLMGEDSELGALRNLANPVSLGDPAHYANRYTGNDDNGGVHTNSTIFSHAAYRMMVDPDTDGISDATWAKLYYQSLLRLGPGATFSDGRAAILDTATTFGFTATEKAAIVRAFNDVGIS